MTWFLMNRYCNQMIGKNQGHCYLIMIKLTFVQHHRGNFDFGNDARMNISSENQTTTSPFAFEQPLALSPPSSESTLDGGLSDDKIPLQTLKILQAPLSV